LSKEQKEKEDKGRDLRKELRNLKVYNANLLDFYLKKENQFLIPEEWENAFFWGTVYNSSSGTISIRYLHKVKGEWCWSYRWLDGFWNKDDPAVVFTVGLNK